MLTAILFDALGTVLEVPPVHEALLERALRDGLALGATGSFAPLDDLIAGELAARGERHPARVLARFRRLRARTDAPLALARTRAHALSVVILTNGSAEGTRAALAHAGLAPLIDEVISVEEAGHYKPHAEAYGHAAQRLSAAPGELALVSAHAWDVHGARLAGLHTAWVRRKGRRFSPVFDGPHATADSLDGAVAALLARAGRAELSPGAGSTPPAP